MGVGMGAPLPLEFSETIASNLNFSFQATIWYALNNYFYEDAIFLAERLHAEGNPSK